MINDKEYEQWKDVHFMYDASDEVLEANYEKAILILRQGIEENLSKLDEPVAVARLLHTLRLLIMSVESSLKNNLGVEFSSFKKVNPPEDTCDFCRKSRSKVIVLISGANGYICNFCVRSLFDELEKRE